MYLSNQWQRFIISATFSYNDPNAPKDSTFYFITEAIPGYSANEYGILSGAGFTIVYAVMLLFVGVLTEHVNRHFLLSGFAIGWSVCTFVSGYAENFTLLLICRFGLGVF
jgi:MFS family permease